MICIYIGKQSITKKLFRFQLENILWSSGNRKQIESVKWKLQLMQTWCGENIDHIFWGMPQYIIVGNQLNLSWKTIFM